MGLPNFELSSDLFGDELTVGSQQHFPGAQLQTRLLSKQNTTPFAVYTHHVQQLNVGII
jgi:hypothetical protein